MSIMITGANGFVGRALHRKLVSCGIETIGLSRRPQSSSGYFQVAFDLFDPTSWSALPPCETVIHLAWYTDHPEFWYSKKNEAFLNASLSFLKFCVERGARQVLVTGTCAEYLDTQSRDPFKLGASKRMLREKLSQEIAKNVKFSWARLFFVFGKGEPETKLFSAVKNGSLNRADVRQPLAIRDFVSCDIVADQLHAIVSHQLAGEMDVGTGRGYRVRDIFSLYKDGDAPIPISYGVADQSEECLIADISWHGKVNYRISEAEVTSAFQDYFFGSAPSPKL